MLSESAEFYSLLSVLKRPGRDYLAPNKAEPTSDRQKTSSKRIKRSFNGEIMPAAAALTWALLRQQPGSGNFWPLFVSHDQEQKVTLPHFKANTPTTLNPYSVSQCQRLACLQVVLSLALKIDMHQLYNLKVVFKKGDCCSLCTSNDHNALLTPPPGVTYPCDVGLKSSKRSCSRSTMVSYLVSTSRNTIRGHNYSGRYMITFLKR